MNSYHMINWFFMFSFLGYLLECAVLSYENRTPVLNRGFVHGPFCIIYGFGAIGAYVILQPFAGRVISLYLMSMLMATSMELITAYLMIRLFGSFWWDYSRKLLNYKGIICLESSLAWGFLGIFFFRFLDQFVHNIVSILPARLGKGLAITLVIGYVIDFSYTVHARIQAAADEEEETAVLGRLKVY